MLSKNNAEITNNLKDASKLVSQLISMLVAIYLICIPLGRIKKDSKFEPVDVGVLMVLLIVNSNLIERITAIKFGKDGFEATMEQKVEKAKKEVEQGIVDQNERDSLAMRWIDLQLSDTTSPRDPHLLAKNILNASPAVIEYIYQRTKDVRHTVAKENRRRKLKGESIVKGILDRTIPIFQALTESSYGKQFHRYHAQFGYALKDCALELKDENKDKDDPKKSKDIKAKFIEARNSLNEAIKLWQNDNPNQTSLPSLYCFNWAESVAESGEKSSLKPSEVQQRIQSAASCKAFEGDQLDKIKETIEKKDGILPIPIDSEPSDGACRSATKLIGF